MKETDFPTGLPPKEEKIKHNLAIKTSSRALLYYLGRYSKHNEHEAWHYTYFNALPDDGRTQEQIGKKLGYSRATISAAFKELTTLGYLEKMSDNYRIYNNCTIWRAIPDVKLDAALEYIKMHNGETWLVEAYVALIVFSRLKREISVRQILQLFGHADNKPSNYVKIIDAIDHLDSNDYCKIIKRKEEPKDGWASYYVYYIGNEMKGVKPTYCERLQGGRPLTEAEILVANSEIEKVLEGNEDETE